MPTFRSTRKGKKCFFVMSLRLSDHKALQNIASSSSFFFDFARIFSLFAPVFRISNFWSLRNLIKQLFHSRLLDTRLVIGNLALHASLAIYHLISKGERPSKRLVLSKNKVKLPNPAIIVFQAQIISYKRNPTPHKKSPGFLCRMVKNH